MKNYELTLSNPENVQEIYEVRYRYLMELKKAGVISDDEAIGQDLENLFKVRCIESFNRGIPSTLRTEQKVELYLNQRYAKVLENGSYDEALDTRDKILADFKRMIELGLLDDMCGKYGIELNESWYTYVVRNNNFDVSCETVETP